MISSSKIIITEGKFRFKQLEKYLQLSDVHFIGFSTLLSNGVPVASYFQTDSFDKLQTWFSSIEKAPLLNVHMIQPIPSQDNVTTPGTFLLSACGVNNRYGDNKYLRAMRLVSGFLASFPKFKLADNILEITIEEWSWFYLRRPELRIGDQIITIEHLENILNDNNYTKLDHGLTKSDIKPKVRQNYRSCVKISSDDVVSILAEEEEVQGKMLYLQLTKLLITIYVEKSAPIQKNEENSVKTTKTNLHGLRIRDEIPKQHEHSYFKIHMNDKVQYIHQQTACYLLTVENSTLSTDRLSRVMQMSRK
ncbi:unnamed protein product [Didymodactylos carnosus]|uniref:Uncharacterized protein n=1 Tax=Didymodactylos carnosus TaxID=1234261 RepID=A0A814N0F7_9BILA|nr:unnamed protein product [Didymodactylos carnosus]CAF3851307.1 unnamed protein product [Didymodactylos carnosus]